MKGFQNFPCNNTKAAKQATQYQMLSFHVLTSCFLDFLLGGIGNAVRHEPPCGSDKGNGARS